eukprot:gene29877-39044_t
MRRILVTGANKGIGFALVRRLLNEFNDTFIYLGSRDISRGEAAVKSLIEESDSWTTRLKLVHIEVDSVSSVQSAKDAIASSLREDHSSLFAVVNNAGVGFGPMFVAKCNENMKQFFTKKDIQWSEIDTLMQSCHPNMKQDDYAAIGIVDSAYGFSKACLNSYMMFLSNEHPNLKINSCTPGYIETDLTKSFEGSKKPPYEGTHSPVALLFKESIGTGKFYGSDCLRSPLDRYRNPGDPEYESD